MKIKQANPAEQDEPLRHCSFCRRDQHTVDLLVAGDGNQAFICPACVELARDIIGARRLGLMNEA